MKPKKVMCFKNGMLSINDYLWDANDVLDYIVLGLREPTEWDANRARGLEKLIELVKANPDDWEQFTVTSNENLKRDVLNVVEKQNGFSYSFYVAYE